MSMTNPVISDWDNKADTSLLQTIYNASLLQGSKSEEAGHGYMGLMVGEGGKAFPVKFLTSWTERGLKSDSSIMKDVAANEHGEKAFASSNRLVDKLIELADKVDKGDEVRGMIAEYQKHADYNQRSLLSRKVVFNVVQTIQTGRLIAHPGFSIDQLNESLKQNVPSSPKKTKTSLNAVFEGLYVKKDFKPVYKDNGDIPSNPSAKFLSYLVDRSDDTTIQTMIDELNDKLESEDKKLDKEVLKDAVNRACRAAGGNEGKFKATLIGNLLLSLEINAGNSERVKAVSTLAFELSEHIRPASQNVGAHDDGSSYISKLNQLRVIKAVIGKQLEKMNLGMSIKGNALRDMLAALKLKKGLKDIKENDLKDELTAKIDLIGTENLPDDKIKKLCKQICTMLNATKLKSALIKAGMQRSASNIGMSEE